MTTVQLALWPIEVFRQERSRQIGSCTPNLSGALAVFLCIGSSPCLGRRNLRRYGSTAGATGSASMPWRRQLSGNMYNAIPDLRAWRGHAGDPTPHTEVLVRGAVSPPERLGPALDQLYNSAWLICNIH